MQQQNQHILDDKLTFGELVERLYQWLFVFLRKWRFLAAMVLLGALLGVAVALLKKPVYYADTTFVLEQSEMGGLGNISGIASMLGLNLGSVGSESGLFKGDNILELYRSDAMLSLALLAPFDTAGESQLLVERYIRFHELDEKWKRKVDFESLNFSLPRQRFSVQQDSVLREVVKEIRKVSLLVDKPDRKLNIIKVTVASKDEDFAKRFNETLVETVNDFYLKTKTKKTAENLSVLQQQADSVRTVLDEKIQQLARFQDKNPNPNPLLQEGMVASRSLQIDIQASAAVYQEIVTNLEIAKINHRNNTPLIQIIDQPRYPLERSEIKLITGILLGAIIFFLLGLAFVYLQTLFYRHFKQ
ncbi:Chain length determinant protein [Cyclobacterium xiamenense]|uniref:Chain length determinant protein n=1 Tax=Cyclobacterium xiamenense TaxID=1297121 RepID=A0A1H6WVV4_9BACT|nr:exopolysaccharide biosynthesis protein [Cyclobacterium xiamenense]SEJ18437.1 Chain length determinant protein [Cyclobacterium xiamenense]